MVTEVEKVVSVSERSNLIKISRTQSEILERKDFLRE
jgi:hypothetical protein